MPPGRYMEGPSEAAEGAVGAPGVRPGRLVSVALGAVAQHAHPVTQANPLLSRSAQKGRLTMTVHRDYGELESSADARVTALAYEVRSGCGDDDRP